MRLIRIALLATLASLPALCLAPFNISCQKGAQKVQTSNIPSTNTFQQSFPGATVTVFIHGGAVGTVTTSGTAVTWRSGTLFNANSDWNGLAITINSVSYVISTVSDTMHLTLTSSAGTQTTAVAYSAASAKAPLFADYAGNTPQSNPFTCNTTAVFLVYSPNGIVDETFSGTGISIPFTVSAVSGVDPIETIPNWIVYNAAVGSWAQQCAAALSANTSIVLGSVVPVPVSFNYTCPIIFLKGGMFQPANGNNVEFVLQSAGLFQVCDIHLGGHCIINAPESVVTPEWWCNVAQGTATDDATCINAALNNFGNAALGTNLVSGPAVVLSGAYSTATSIIAQNKSLTLRCNGWGTTNADIPACYIKSQAALVGSPELIIRNCMGLKVEGIRFIGSVANPPSAAIVFDQQAGTANELNRLSNIYIGELPDFDGDTGQQFDEGIVFSGINANNGQNLGTDIWIYGAGIGIDLQHGQYGLNMFDGIEIWNSGTYAVKSGARVKLTHAFFTASGSADLGGTNGTGGDGNPQFYMDYFGSENSARFADFTTGGFSSAYLELDNGYFLGTSSMATDGKWITGITDASQNVWSGIWRNMQYANSDYASAQVIVGSSGTTITIQAVAYGTVATGQTITCSGIVPYATTITGGSGVTWTISATPSSAMNNTSCLLYSPGKTAPVIDISQSGGRSRELICEGCVGIEHSAIRWSPCGILAGAQTFNLVSYHGSPESYVNNGLSSSCTAASPNATLNNFQNTQAQHVGGNNLAPGCIAGPAAGSGSGAPCSPITGDDVGGTFIVSVSGSTTSGVLATLTFNKPYTLAHCHFSASNSAAAQYGSPVVFGDNVATSTWNLNANAGLNTGPGSYSFDYGCSGN